MGAYVHDASTNTNEILAAGYGAKEAARAGRFVMPATPDKPLTKGSAVNNWMKNNSSKFMMGGMMGGMVSQSLFGSTAENLQGAGMSQENAAALGTISSMAPMIGSMFGPWGAAAGAVVSIITPAITKLLDKATVTDEEVKKIRSDMN